MTLGTWEDFHESLRKRCHLERGWQVETEASVACLQVELKDEDEVLTENPSSPVNPSRPRLRLHRTRSRFPIVSK